ncbi:MAG: hypothetical protein WBG08_11690 [Litorimonas sp.]
MLKLSRLSASSLALLFALFGSAHGQVPVESDPTYDVEAADPAVEAALTAKERELAEFFDDTPVIDRDRYEPVPELNAREEAALLERAEQEAEEFNDIDDDDLAQLDRPRALGQAPRLEKPGQVEKDLPVACPLGTEELAGTCVGDVE